jgi:hypothetical protein
MRAAGCAALDHNYNLMNNDSDRNYVSVGSWMWMMFVTAIPIVGFIMMIVWCFTGDNESRKNYFRAIWAWIFLAAAIALVFVLLGNAPSIMKQIQSWTHKT